jgi:hypothetical protein
LELLNPFAPPDHVSRWISISWAGNVNHPIMPVFYFTEHRTPPPINRYVYLTEQEFRLLQLYTHSVHCSRDKVSVGPSNSGPIAIHELADGQFRNLCIFPRNPGCDYLFRLAALPGIDWSRKDTYPLYQFEAELGCKEPLTKSHDAAGRSN